MAKGGGIQIAGQISSRGLSFFFQAILSQVLGISAYGLYNKVVRALGVGAQIGLMGFNYSGMRFITRARAKKDHPGVKGAIRIALAGSGITSAIVFVAFIVAADAIAPLFSKGDAAGDEMARLIRVGAIYIPLYALLQTLRYCTQAYKTMLPSVVAGSIVQPLARFAAGSIALAVGFGVDWAIGTLAFSMGVAAIVAAWYVLRMMTAEERAAKPRASVRDMIGFALPQAGASLLGIQALGLGILVLSSVKGDFQVGLFAAAVALQGPGTVFLSGIVNIWAPIVSDIYEKGEIARLDSLYKTITRWVATFSFPVFAALMIEPQIFASLFTRENADAVAPVVVILALGQFFYAGTGPTGYVLSMTGRPGVNFINSIVAVVAYTLIGIPIARRHGAVGMAWVDTAIVSLVNIVRVVQAKVLVGVQPFGRSFLKPLVATAAGAAVLLLWKLIPGDSIPLGVAGIAVSAVVYLAVLRVMGIDPEEREVWDRIRKRTKRRGPRT